MIFLFVLTFASAVAAAVLKLRGTFSIRRTARIGMAIGMAFAGVSHLLMPTPFVQHLPTWMPMREELIFTTGLLEILLGAILLHPSLRRLAGLALAGYLLAVFPSNIYVAVAGVEVDGQPGGAYPWIRLPLQLLFIAWALWATQGSRPPTDTTTPRTPGLGSNTTGARDQATI
jgi:uncharacterized membrane protein